MQSTKHIDEIITRLKKSKDNHRLNVAIKIKSKLKKQLSIGWTDQEIEMHAKDHSNK